MTHLQEYDIIKLMVNLERLNEKRDDLHGYRNDNGISYHFK